MPFRNDNLPLVQGDTQIGDIFVNHELPCERFLAGRYLPSPDWWMDESVIPSWRKMEEVYGCTEEWEMRAVVDGAKSRGTGIINVQGRIVDEVSIYDDLPPFWEAEVSYILSESGSRGRQSTQ